MTKKSFHNPPSIKFFAEDNAVGRDIGEQRLQLHDFRNDFGDVDETYCCAFSPDGTLLAWSRGNGFVEVVRVSSKSLTEKTEFQKFHCCTIDCSQDVVTLVYSPVTTKISTNDERRYLLATGLACGKIKLWNPESGELKYNLSDHRETITGLSFMIFEELLLISSSKDRTLKVWDLGDDGNMTLTLRGHPFPVLDCSCSPVAPLICSVGRGRMAFIWRLQHKRNPSYCKQLRGHNNDVTSTSWSPDGALLATASNDTTVIVWDPATTQQVLILGHVNPLPQPIFAGGANGSWLTCVRFSPDGSRLATLCEDNRLRLWGLWCNSISRSAEVSKPGTTLSFSPGGSVIAIGHTDGSLSLMEAGVTVMKLQHLCRIVIRRFFPVESIVEMELPPFIQKYLQYVSSGP